MMNLGTPWWELVLRAVIVYVFLLFLLRMTGKRQIGQLAPFDLVLLLVLSNAVQNAMTAGENSLIGGLISATTLVALNFAVGFATFRSKRMEAWIEGRPEVLIHNGKLYHDVIDRAQLTPHELNAALRQAGCAAVEDVHSAILENNGAISVLCYRGGQHPVNHSVQHSSETEMVEPTGPAEKARSGDSLWSDGAGV
ncbi:MAG: YetF domain-containing protein [Candidatus Ozemobacteraceae bacterium]